jgi:hypothetical protein
MGDVLADEGLTARCEVASPVGSDLTLLAYRVDARPEPVSHLQLASLQLSPAAPAPTPMEARERDGARKEILAAARAVVEGTGLAEFTIADVLLEMRRRGTRYADATIRTMMSSHLCAESLGNGIAGHADLRRVGRGTYRLASG